MRFQIKSLKDLEDNISSMGDDNDRITICAKSLDDINISYEYTFIFRGDIIYLRDVKVVKPLI